MNINIYPLSFHVLSFSLWPRFSPPSGPLLPSYFTSACFPGNLTSGLAPSPTHLHIIVSERTRRLPDKVPIILLTARPLLVPRLQVRSLHVLRFTRPLVSLSSSRANFPLLRLAFHSLNQLLGNASSPPAFARSLDKILREFRGSICLTPFAKHIP